MNKNEEWRIIPSFSSYEVSNYGRIRSNRGKKGKYIFQSCTEQMKWYPQATLCRDGGERENWFIHRLVAYCFLDDYAPHMMVLHKDGSKTNNHVSNLKMGSHKENAGDAIRHGTLARGERHGKSKLTERQVRLIKHLLLSGRKQTEIAKLFNVTKYAISHIYRGKTWKHI